MNITMLHDLDTGFMAATLKPAFEALGHTCTIVQTLTTYLESDTSHIDYLLTEMEDIEPLKEVFRDTDLFILRSITDFSLKGTGVLSYITPHNTIWRVHGSELRDRNMPYSLRTWKINWYNKEPIIVGPADSTLLPLYRENTITSIERPCAFDTFPKIRRNNKEPFALTTPTNPSKKGTQSLIDNWNSKIPLHVISGVSRTEALKWKSQASYFIDSMGSYKHAPYNMNSVEAWYYRIPVFSKYEPIDEALCPDLPSLVHKAEEHYVQHNIEHYEPDKKQLNYARTYALRTHDPKRIAQQYINLAKEIEQ